MKTDSELIVILETMRRRIREAVDRNKGTQMPMIDFMTLTGTGQYIDLILDELRRRQDQLEGVKDETEHHS